jgi:hypothetical protein
MKQRTWLNDTCYVMRSGKPIDTATIRQRIERRRSLPRSGANGVGPTLHGHPELFRHIERGVWQLRRKTQK